MALSCSVSELLDLEEIESSHKINNLLHYAIQHTRSRFLHGNQTTNRKPHYNFKTVTNLMVYWSIANLEHIIDAGLLTMPTTNGLLRTEQFA